MQKERESLGFLKKCGYLKSLEPTVVGNLCDVAWNWMPAIVGMSNRYNEGPF